MYGQYFWRKKWFTYIYLFGPTKNLYDTRHSLELWVLYLMNLCRKKFQDLSNILKIFKLWIYRQNYMSYFPRFPIPREERGKKWNSSWGNEEISRNLFTLKKHLIIAKSKHKVSIPKSTKFFVKFLTTKNFFIVFSCIKFFQIRFFLIFLEFFYSIL